MDPRLLLGLQLTRFAPSDDAADALAGSLTAIEAGGYALSPYEGPALEPLIGLSLPHLDLALAPAAALRREQATAADGRDDTVAVVQVRVGALALYRFGPGRAGLEAGWSDGTARLGGEAIASSTSQIELIPTLGIAAPLTEAFELGLRARWTVIVAGPEISQSLGGALTVTWRGGAE